MKSDLYFRKETPVSTVNSCSQLGEYSIGVIVYFALHLTHLPLECQFREGRDCVFFLSIHVFPGSSTLLILK